MQLSKPLITLVMIWTTPISGFPRPQSGDTTGNTETQKKPEQNQGGTLQGHAKSLLMGGGIFAAGWAAGKFSNRKLNSKIENLEREIRSQNRGHATFTDDVLSKIENLDRQIRSQNGGDTNHPQRQRQTQHADTMDFVQAFGIKRDTFPQVIKIFNQGDQEVRLCINEALGTGEPGVVKLLRGHVWNAAVMKCNGASNLFIHPDDTIWFGLPLAENMANSMNQQAQTQQQQRDEEDHQQGNVNLFAPVKLFGERLMNGIQKGQRASPFNAMPAGVPSRAGAQLPAFGAL